MTTNAVIPDQLGGLQRYVRELAVALAAGGQRVTLLTRQVSPELPAHEVLPEGVVLRRYPVAPRSDRFYALKYPVSSLTAVGRAVRALGGALVHVHFPVQGAAPALLDARYVHTFHAPVYREILPEHRNRYVLPDPLARAAVRATRTGEGFVARRARATVVLSRYMRGQLAHIAPEASSRATVIPGGIDVNRFAPGRPVTHPFARSGSPLLFTARRLVPRTGVGELIRAMRRISAQIPDCRLAIAGDGPLRADLEQLIGGLGLREHVRLLGRVSEDDLVGWYRAATLFVLPTQELEGFGISTIEALSCGTPAVGTPVGGTPEILADIDARMLASGVSADHLAAAVIDVLSSPDTLAALAETVRTHVVRHMAWPAIADRHREIYERAAAAG